MGTANEIALLLVMAFEMLIAATSDSPWLPLICNHPESYPELPFHWSDSKFEYFRDIHDLRDNVDLHLRHWSSNLLEDVAYVNLKYKHIVPDGLPSKYFIWAAFSYRSRVYGLPGHTRLHFSDDVCCEVSSFLPYSISSFLQAEEAWSQ